MSDYTTALHKFPLGTQVKMHRTLRGAQAEGVVYEVTRQLPSENNDFQYRLRTLDGRGERVAPESQLLQASLAELAAAEAKPPSRRF